MTSYKNKKQGNYKQYLLLYLMIIFIPMFFWNLCTPLFDDDIYSTHLLWSQIPYWAIHDYWTWNGRIIGQSIMRCLQIGNPIIVSFLNALIFTVLVTIIWILGTNSKNRLTLPSLNKLMICFIISFIAIPSFGQTILWRSGAGNYLWTTVIILLFALVYIYRPLSQNKYHKFYQLTLLCTLGFISGWCTENTSIAVTLILTLFTIINKKIDRLKIISLIFSFIGWLFLIKSPGNIIRTYSSVGKEYLKQPIHMRIINGIVTINTTLLNDYWLLISIILLLFFLMINFYFNKNKLINSIIWFIGGLATIYSLSMSPIEQNGGRTYFGGIICWIIVLITLLPDNFKHLSKCNKALFEFLLLTTIIYFIITGFNGVVDSIQSDNAIKQQYEIVQSIKKHSKSNTISVPNISYYPKTKYSIDNNLEQIGKDPNAFPNVGYKIKFGVKVQSK